ncbi:hypothetical protein ACFV1W_34830 [Kitasatospora sp. NPDC059648]|uniref:hypothetical protein n=1 Tax=Kitasatospora sp. NPDC059648 TaxID=3346894 RepID=UPI00367F1D27
MPGWFGDLLLSPDEVKASLPAVEAVFALDEEERARVVERAPEVLVEGYNSDGIEAMVDGVVPVWRAAAETGQGLFATQVGP